MSRQIWGWVVFLPLLAIVITVGAAFIFLPAYVAAIAIGASLARATVARRGGHFVALLVPYAAIVFVLGAAVTIYLLPSSYG